MAQMFSMLIRHPWLSIGVAAIAIAAGAIVYMTEVEPGWLKLDEQNVQLESWNSPKPLVILQLSDLHVDNLDDLKRARRAVELGLKSKPDIVVLTGDFITTQLINESERYSEILKSLSEAAPSFACLGNHDGGSWADMAGGYSNHSEVKAMLEKASIRVLFNSAADIEVKGAKVRIVGLGDLWSNEASPEQAFTKQEGGTRPLTAVIEHNPDAKTLLEPYAWDLMLCGHTHGGQLQIPFLGAPFTPVRDASFASGLKSWKNRWIYTSAGVGNLHGARLNCRPQVSVLKIMKADK